MHTCLTYTAYMRIFYFILSIAMHQKFRSFCNKIFAGLFLILIIQKFSVAQEFGTLKLPDPNTEEGSSPHTPSELRCDACRIIAHLLFEAFNRTSHRKLSESDVLEVAESVCHSKFDRYGITEINGRPRLKGPGLETDGIPGVTRAGGKWPFRLHQTCENYVGDLGEEEIYEQFLRSKSKSEFSAYMCEQSGDLAVCKDQTK